MYKKSLHISLALLSCYFINANADTTITTKKSANINKCINTEIPKDSSHSIIEPYQANYVLPFYYTQYPDQIGIGPNHVSIMSKEVKFQFSIKANIWRNIFHSNTDLYLAYTQLSYWQAYSKSAFFRESNYEPAVFLTHHIQWKFGAWELQDIQLGVEHQSNGRGGEFERSWNRVFADFIIKYNNWLVIDYQPWYRLTVTEPQDYNPDITEYLGHGEIRLSALLPHDNELTLISRNNIESGFSRGSLELDWSFPILHNLKGYVQASSGFGQSLIEYNHYTNAAGVGFALSDW